MSLIIYNFSPYWTINAYKYKHYIVKRNYWIKKNIIEIYSLIIFIFLKCFLTLPKCPFIPTEIHSVI